MMNSNNNSKAITNTLKSSQNPIRERNSNSSSKNDRGRQDQGQDVALCPTSSSSLSRRHPSQRRTTTTTRRRPFPTTTTTTTATAATTPQQPIALCVNIDVQYVSDVQQAARMVGWTVELLCCGCANDASSREADEAVDAISTRSYHAMVVGFGTLDVHGRPYCSPLVAFARRAAPTMYRIVYCRGCSASYYFPTPSQIQGQSQQQQVSSQQRRRQDLIRLVNSCFRNGADALVWSKQSLACALQGFGHLVHMVPRGTSIAAHSQDIYSSYPPLCALQERQDQLICIAHGKWTKRVQELRVTSSRLQWQLLHSNIPKHFVQNITTYSSAADRYKSSRSTCTTTTNSLRLVHVSDTNNHHAYLRIPPGDVFVHTGNVVNPLECQRRSALDVFCDFLSWLDGHVVPKFDLVLFVAGNHDDLLDRQRCCSLNEHLQARQILKDFLQTHKSVRYLENSSVIFANIVFYGSPIVYCNNDDNDDDDDVYNSAIGAAGMNPRTNVLRAFERSMEEFEKDYGSNINDDDSLRRRRVLDGVDVFLTNRAPSILSSQKDYVLPMDYIYDDHQHGKTKRYYHRRRHVLHRPLVHAFGHCNHKFGIGYLSRNGGKNNNRDGGTLMMNGSQELLHNLDVFGGGTPLVVDVPLCCSDQQQVSASSTTLMTATTTDNDDGRDDDAGTSIICSGPTTRRLFHYHDVGEC